MTINQIIPDHFKAFSEKNKDFPEKVLELLHDLLITADRKALDKDAIEKISLFCNVKKESVIPSMNASSIYEVPSLYSDAGLDIALLNHLKLDIAKHSLDLKPWKKVINKVKNPQINIKIGVVGKYTNLKDSYKSLNEALVHGGIANNVNVKINWINAEELNNNKILKELCNVDGILIPGGFGYRGIEGKISAIKFAREKKIPFFGICLGMQLSVIEIAVLIEFVILSPYKITKPLAFRAARPKV